MAPGSLTKANCKDLGRRGCLAKLTIKTHFYGVEKGTYKSLYLPKYFQQLVAVAKSRLFALTIWPSIHDCQQLVKVMTNVIDLGRREGEKWGPRVLATFALCPELL